jgi:hypothetical protein
MYHRIVDRPVYLRNAELEEYLLPLPTRYLTQIYLRWQAGSFATEQMNKQMRHRQGIGWIGCLLNLIKNIKIRA